MIEYNTLAPVAEQGKEIGALVRHLKARLAEFDCVTLEKADETTGEIQVVFEGFAPGQVAEALGRMPGVQVAVAEDFVVFFLRKDHRHETNDSIWGGLYRYICIEAEEERP